MPTLLLSPSDTTSADAISSNETSRRVKPKDRNQEITTLNAEASRRVKPKDRNHEITALNAEASHWVNPGDRNRKITALNAEASRRVKPKTKTLKWRNYPYSSATGPAPQGLSQTALRPFQSGDIPYNIIFDAALHRPPQRLHLSGTQYRSRGGVQRPFL